MGNKKIQAIDLDFYSLENYFHFFGSGLLAGAAGAGVVAGAGLAAGATLFAGAAAGLAAGAGLAVVAL